MRYLGTILLALFMFASAYSIASEEMTPQVQFSDADTHVTILEPADG